MIETYDLRKKLEPYIIGLLVLIAVFYGIFRAYPLLSGPSITIYSPGDGDPVASTTFEVSGRVLRSREITLQGRQITIDTEGHFKETLVPYYPYTIIIISAKDQYGAEVTKTLRVIPKD
ncbi:MAG: seg [Candidatus Nomurabacteria bacterium]|nr:seg [Candidatus Nomurabacteria bacterium]